MQKTPSPPIDTELRQRAEARLSERGTAADRPIKETDLRRLLHELQVHHIELEMQNEELQQARDSMEAGLEKFSDLYDFAPVGFLTLDREGTVREANLTTASLLGIERSRLVNRRFGLWLSPADVPAFNAFLTRVFESKAGQSCEVTLLREGKPPVAARIEAVVAASGQECRAMLDDITEQKRTEEDRLILNKLESTGILAAGIAHDFNNLLTMILLNLELAQTLIPPGEELAHRLEQAKQAGLMAAGLTRQLASFGAGGAPVRKPALLAGLIEASVRLAVSGSVVRCDFSLAEDLWPAEVDAGQIGQVIRNLVLNAREAKPAGGVISVRAENEVLGPQGNPSLPSGDYVRISITDWGGGIPKEVLPRIFDPYFSTKQRGTQKGMGLGLTICHTIIQKHGGAIAVESEPGVGTTFRIHLPASRMLLQKEKAFVPSGVLGHGRILVMDDEEVIRKLVRRLLQEMGHEVELVEDGQSAVGAYESARGQGRPFDAVILDLTIRDGIGGQETIRELLKIDPAVKAIVMSGYPNDPAVLEPERYGFEGVLTKPFDKLKLGAVLSLVLRSANSGQGLKT